MKGYVRLELLRTLRDPFYIFLAIVAPIGFYLLFSGLFGASPHAPETLSGNVEIMVAMAVYGGIWACLVATGPRIAVERGNGWLRNLRLLPVANWKILAGRAVVAMLFALPAIVLVCGTAMLAHGVRLGGGQWIALVLLLWVGVWPFAIFGIALGYITNDSTAFGLTYGIYMAISALGGLWVPPAILPANMLAFGKVLPTYQAADLGWHVANGRAPTLGSAIGLAVWTIVFVLGATLFSRRVAKIR